MEDCKTCKYLDRFNCCCSIEPIMTCKAEMEEHDKQIRAEALEPFQTELAELNECELNEKNLITFAHRIKQIVYGD